MAIGPCDFWRLAVDFELLDLHALSNVSAASTATNACVLQSANLFFFRPTPYGFRQVVQHVSKHVAQEIN